MGVIRRWATERIHVLVIGTPGAELLRMNSEAAVTGAGHILASDPADADLLLVCGTPGQQLSTAVNRIWDSMPIPKHRVIIHHVPDIPHVLATSTVALADDAQQRHNAQHRPYRQPHPNEPDLTSDRDSETPRKDEPSATHGGMDHGGHGGMGMSGPGDYPLASGAEDRDGLEMDVLHRTLGPVLAMWPSGLVVHVTLAGDSVTDAAVEFLDDRGSSQDWDHELVEPLLVAADRADRVGTFLQLCEWSDMAHRLWLVRDVCLSGRAETARTRFAAANRRIRRSRSLRWSVRGLPSGPGVSVLDRLTVWLDEISAALDGQSRLTHAHIHAGDVPALIIGRDIGEARIVLSTVDIVPGEAHHVPSSMINHHDEADHDR